MNPLFLKHVIEELDGSLKGGILSKIHQPDERNLILRVFAKGREERLLISTHPLFSRLHLTEVQFVNPPRPLRFCSFLRSRIEGARIEGFYQKEGERIAGMRLSKGKDAGEGSFSLIAELTGKSSNVILVDGDGVVLDSMKYFPQGSSVRAVVPGIRLTPLISPGPLFGMGKREEALPSKEEGESWNMAAERHYSALTKGGEYALRRNALRRAVNEARKKAARLLKNLLGDKDRAGEALSFQKFGELIIANLEGIRRGDSSALLDDYTVLPPAKVRVPLDEKTGPRENAERYFRRVKKAKAALALLNGRIPGVQEEMEYIDSLLFELDSAKTPEDLDELQEEMREAGYARGHARASVVKEKKEAPGEPIKRFTSSEGFEMLVGKSGKGNDLIVKRYAKDDDVWLHAARVPGAHVLVKTAGRERGLTIKTIEEAAALAAFNSKSRDESKAEVIYTEARNVRKPRGAKPGMVTVKEYKTIMARPKGM